MDDRSRPRLAGKARLRRDRVTGKLLLLYPERGLALNDTAAEILELCTGELSVEEIIERLVGKYGVEKRAALAEEVRGFLRSLADRNLLRGTES